MWLFSDGGPVLRDNSAAMRVGRLIGPDLSAMLEADPEDVLEAVGDIHAEDLAEIVEAMPQADALQLLRLLPNERAADIVERLSPELQVEIVQRLGSADAIEILAEMDRDDAVDVVQELQAEQAQSLLAELEKAEPEAADEIRVLVHHGKETAGGLMTTEFVALVPETKVWEAIEEVRRQARELDVETIYYIYVCHYGSQLLGVVSLRELILSDPAQTLAEIMNTKVLHVELQDDQEIVAQLMARYDLNAIPVVDDHGRMVGVVTVDDVVDVVISEATEDVQKMGGVVPLEDPYFDTGWLSFVWKRGAWLVLLFLGQLLTATVMEQHQGTLRQVVALSFFIPLIIASGGNAGSQSSTLIIRAMAVGEVAPKDWLRVFVRELAVGAALGIVLGAMGFARASLVGEMVDPFDLALVVGASILSIVVLSTVVGSLLPIAIRRIGLDPAVSSTPFIASVVDVLGLIVYFTFAGLLLQAMN